MEKVAFEAQPWEVFNIHNEYAAPGHEELCDCGKLAIVRLIGKRNGWVDDLCEGCKKTDERFNTRWFTTEVA